MTWKEEFERNLLDNLIPFWDLMFDSDKGGFYGTCSNEGVININSQKGAVYLTRLLWSNSKLYKKYKDSKFLKYAKSTFDFIENYLYDKVNNGVMWCASYDGKIVDDQKHLYAQSFYLYAISEYYSITNDSLCLTRMEEVSKIVEDNLIDFPNNYYESYTYDFKPKQNEIMAGHNMIPEITTNTLLHLAEGMSNCYLYTKNEKYKLITTALIDILFKYGYDSVNKNLYQFLDYHLENQVDVVSYGHNIEVSWLFKKIIIECEIERKEYLKFCNDLAIQTINDGFKEGYLYNEKYDGKLDKSSIWWVQAECIIGFDYYFDDEYSQKVFNHMKEKIFTKLEWIWGRDEFDNVITSHNQVEMWKANYHNVRAILEITGEINGK